MSRPQIPPEGTGTEAQSLGRGLGEIMQVAYVVEDIDRALRHWTKTLKVGPFFLFEHFRHFDAVYRGQPTEPDITVALTLSGAMNFALIVQNGDAPSVYREAIDRHGYGFHHWEISTRTFEADVARLEQSGAPVALSGVASVGARAAYMDTCATLGGMTDLIEMNAKVEAFFGSLHAAAQGWDGTDPVRSLGT